MGPCLLKIEIRNDIAIYKEFLLIETALINSTI